jgi:hypothetical protein
MTEPTVGVTMSDGQIQGIAGAIERLRPTLLSPALMLAPLATMPAAEGIGSLAPGPVVRRIGIDEVARGLALYPPQVAVPGCGGSL